MDVLIATSYCSAKAYCRNFIIPAARMVANGRKCLIILDGVSADEEKYFKEYPDSDDILVISLPKFESSTPDYHRYHKLARVRNTAREYFLANSEYSALYFHDADMVSPPETISLLQIADASIASGVYLQRGASAPAITASVDPHGSPNEVPLVDPRQLDLRAFSVSIGYVGMGCCLLSREVLAAVEFEPGGPNLPGEDFQFCARAYDVGFGHPVLVPSVSSWHFEDNGVGRRLTIGEQTYYAVYVGDMQTVRNVHGVWERNIPKYDLPANSKLPPEFKQGYGNHLTIETATFQELFDAANNSM